jgi:hypothetical protein
VLERLLEGSERQRKKLAAVARLWARGELHLTHHSQTHEADAVDEALAAFGLEQADEQAATPDDVCYLWPCNARAFNVWQRIQTQWRTGMSGRTGLDWCAVDLYLSTLGSVRPKARAELWAGLRAMEGAALQAWAEQQD